MKKILITQRLLKHESYNEIRDVLDINYPRMLQECGFLTVVLPSEQNFESYFKELKINGILLTGGNDLYIFDQNDLSKKRDTLEFSLIDYAIENNIPLYGICRGMQVIAHYFGSSFKKVFNHINKNHDVFVNKESKFFNDLMNIQNVNSFHQYALDCIGNDLMVSVRSKDGEIEAIEHKKYKIFAQMWHSERKEPFCKNELTLIMNFFNEGKE